MPLAARASREKGSEGRTKLTGNLLQRRRRNTRALVGRERGADSTRSHVRDTRYPGLTRVRRSAREATRKPSIAGRLNRAGANGHDSGSGPGGSGQGGGEARRWRGKTRRWNQRNAARTRAIWFRAVSAATVALRFWTAAASLVARAL